MKPARIYAAGNCNSYSSSYIYPVNYLTISPNSDNAPIMECVMIHGIMFPFLQYTIVRINPQLMAKMICIVSYTNLLFQTKID